MRLLTCLIARQTTLAPRRQARKGHGGGRKAMARPVRRRPPGQVGPAPPICWKSDRLGKNVACPRLPPITRPITRRMGRAAAQKVADCFDGKLNPKNVINKDALG